MLKHVHARYYDKNSVYQRVIHEAQNQGVCWDCFILIQFNCIMNQKHCWIRNQLAYSCGGIYSEVTTASEDKWCSHPVVCVTSKANKISLQNRSVCSCSKVLSAIFMKPTKDHKNWLILCHTNPPPPHLFWPFDSHKWPRHNFPLQYQYIRQISDRNKEKHQIGNYKLIQNKIL